MVLSFFLWIGTICAFNQSEGGVPEFIDFWNMIVRMGAIVEAIFFQDSGRDIIWALSFVWF